MVTLQENESIEGQISVAPNQRNPRDLDIVIDYEAKGEQPVKERREYRMCVHAMCFPYLVRRILTPVLVCLQGMSARGGCNRYRRGRRRWPRTGDYLAHAAALMQLRDDTHTTIFCRSRPGT